MTYNTNTVSFTYPFHYYRPRFEATDPFNPVVKPSIKEESKQEVTKALSTFVKGMTLPSHCVIDLASPFEIKRLWLYSEWDSRNPTFSGIIRRAFKSRFELDPSQKKCDYELVESTFDRVRGKYILWQAPKETAQWKKVVVEKLALEWVIKNVKILYPSNDNFKVTELNGLVLWQDPTKEQYQLLEGNHRISTWTRAKTPAFLPSIIFIGKAS